MKANEIREGVTYTFVATDSLARKHLEGEPFTVVRIESVFRRLRHAGTRKVRRFFNEAGDGARAEELEHRDNEPQERKIPAEEPPDDDLPF